MSHPSGNIPEDSNPKQPPAPASRTDQANLGTSSPQRDIYDLAPASDPVSAPQGVPPLLRGKVVERAATKTVGDGSLIDGFDEDADFTRDPEVERVLSNTAGSAPTSVSSSFKGPPADAFVKPGLGTAEQIYIAAGAVTIAAVIAAGVTAAGRGRVWYADCILTLYVTLLHTLTGAAAVMAAAHLSEKRLGELPLATARMGLAVAVFQLLWHLNITAIPLRFDETALAIGGYFLTAWALFRLPRERITLLAMLHGAIWFAIYFAAQLWVWSLSKVTVVAPAAVELPVTPAM
jgi:hypothetical protein